MTQGKGRGSTASAPGAVDVSSDTSTKEKDPWGLGTLGLNAATSDYYFVTGRPAWKGVVQSRDRWGNLIIGNPDRGWVDPKAPYGRDKHGHALKHRHHGDKNLRLGIPFPTGKNVKAKGEAGYSANDVVQAFIGSNALTVAHVQQLLFRSGFYGADEPLYGKIRPDDIKAFTAAYQTALLSGQGLEDYLTGTAKAGDAVGITEPKRPEFSAHLTDAGEIGNRLAMSGTDLLGRGLTPGEQAQIASQARDEELLRQRRAYDGGDDNYAGNTVTDSDLASLVQKQNPSEFAVNRTLGQNAQAFIDLLGNGPSAGLVQ
jgi:hypothetical protein